MIVPFDKEEFHKKFERNKGFYTSKVMIHHIAYNLKKVEKVLSMNKSKSYFQKSV